MYFIGVDLAWSEKNETGLAVLDEKGDLLDIRAGVYSNQDIADYIQSFDFPSHVAIDAPLVVPNQTGSRPAERDLPSRKVGGHTLRAFHCSRDYLIKHYGSIRAEEIAKKLPDHNLGIQAGGNSLIETFPTGILAALFPDKYPFNYKIKSGTKLSQAKLGLEKLMQEFPDLAGLKVDTTYTGKVHKHVEDQVDAYLCAYALYHIYLNDWHYQIFGNLDQGFILLPKSKS